MAILARTTRICLRKGAAIRSSLFTETVDDGRKGNGRGERGWRGIRGIIIALVGWQLCGHVHRSCLVRWTRARVACVGVGSGGANSCGITVVAAAPRRVVRSFSRASRSIAKVQDGGSDSRTCDSDRKRKEERQYLAIACFRWRFRYCVYTRTRWWVRLARVAPDTPGYAVESSLPSSPPPPLPLARSRASRGCYRRAEESIMFWNSWRRESPRAHHHGR